MSLLPVRHNFKIYPGTTFHYRFLWNVENEGVAKPQNLSEFTGTFTVTPVGTETPWLTLTQTPNSNGSVLTFSGTSGYVDIVIQAADTSAINWQQANFKLLVVQPVPLETLPLIVGKMVPVLSL